MKDFVVQSRDEARRNIEAQYLGCLIRDHSLLDEAVLTPQVFQEKEHKNLFKLLSRVFKAGKVLDFITVSLLSEKDLNGIGGISYFRQVYESVVSINQFKIYENMIHEFYTQAEMLSAASDFMVDMHTAPTKERVEQYIQDVQRVELATTKPAESFKSKLYQRFDEHQSSPLEGLTGVDTGLKTLNQLTDGWQRKDLIVIGARPSVGKTLAGLGTLLKGEQADPDIMPTFMSAEMAIGGVIDRCIANVGGVNLSKLRNFNKYLQSEQDRIKYNMAVGKLEKMNFDVFEENTVPAIRARMRQRIKENPDKKHICCIDFLTQLRPTNPTGNQNVDYGIMVLDIKQMAKDLNIPVILLVQLNRQNEQRQDKRPSMSDIRDTGTVEQAADIIAFLHREDYYERDRSKHNNILEMNIAKHRQGATGGLQFYVDLATQNFHDM